MTLQQLRKVARLLRLGPTFVAAKATGRRIARRVLWRGDSVTCPCCGVSASRFGTNKSCGFCDSKPRHRFLALYLGDKLTNADFVLHFAPEPCLADRFRRIPEGMRYLSADLKSTHADILVDLHDGDSAIRALGERRFSWVIASHVLEHINDDLAAMSLFAQLLLVDGHCLLQVPMSLDPTTYEDWTITSEQGRLQAFGQEDHVRVYGSDFVDRLRQAGLNPRELNPTSIYSLADQMRFGLERDLTYVCSVDLADSAPLRDVAAN